MIHSNPNQKLRLTLVNAYCTCVARRNGLPKWSMPKVWIDDVERVLSFLCGKNVSTSELITVYINAQFDALDAKFCRRAFKRPYPPLNVFATSASFMRYQDKKLRTTKPDDTPVDEKVWDRIQSDLRTIRCLGSVSFDYNFLLLSGTITVHTVAYLFLTGEIGHPRYRRIRSFLREEAEFIYEQLNVACNVIEELLIKKGGADAVESKGSGTTVEKEIDK